MHLNDFCYFYSVDRPNSHLHIPHVITSHIQPHIHITHTCTHKNMHAHTQVPRNADEYIGEILLGLKYRPQKSCDREGDLPQSDVEEDSGQLHVHIVEGAGICSEDTHQPFNAFVKW